MQSTDPFSYWIRTGIYIKDREEEALYHKWMALPHPELQITLALEDLSEFELLPDFTPALEAEVAATIMPEQEKRFAFVLRSFTSDQSLVL